MKPEKENHLVRLVNAFGPRNLTLIARRLNVSRETVARSYAELVKSGMDTRPDISVGMLGLQRYVALVTPDRNTNTEKMESLFDVMGDYAYLEHYQSLAPSNAYLLIFSAPPKLIGELTDFLSLVGKTSSLGVVGPVRLSWYRYHPIRASWNPPPAEPVVTGPLAYVPDDEEMPRRPNVGFEELLLLAAIQAYPDANMVGLSKALATWADAGYEEVKETTRLSSSDWNEHYRRALKTIRSYPVGLARGPPGTTARRHRWVSFTALWEGLDEEGVRRAAMSSTSVPYLRTDACSTELGLYFSIISSPSHLVPGYMNFMTRNAPERMRVGIASKFGNYSVPFTAFIPAEGRWAWKQERLESQLATLRVG